MNVNILWPSFFGLVLTSSSTASAEKAIGDPGANYATVGASLSVGLCCGSGGVVGFGPAVNYAHWVSGQATLGAFGSLHYYPALDAARTGIGPQASYLWTGVEVGPSLFFAKEAPTG